MTEVDVSFQPVGFADLPGWEEDDHAAALTAFLGSLRPAAEAFPDAERLDAEARSALYDGTAAARHFFESRFTPNRIHHASGRGLLTGYYEPVLAGSRERTGPYQTPIYARPPDLINLVDEAMRGSSGVGLTHARKEGNRVVPYATRAEIESGALDGRGLEVLYLADPVDAFFMHIQGSGLIELTDGSSVRLTYDGKNGHPYTSIGRHLIEAGAFQAEELTMDVLVQWLRSDLERSRQVMWQNASFVFFRELARSEASSALGAMGVPLTPGRSLAVDASIHRLGTPVYVVAPTLTHSKEGGPFQRLMIAQDVGSAIRGPERGDIYFGTGSEAGRRAGITRNQGKFFALLPKRARETCNAP